MEKEIKAEIKCENCKYYAQHYIMRNKDYHITNCGHCLKRKDKKILPFPCKYWDDIAIKEEERKKSIKQTLEMICERLNNIADVLKDSDE